MVTNMPIHSSRCTEYSMCQGVVPWASGAMVGLQGRQRQVCVLL